MVDGINQDRPKVPCSSVRHIALISFDCSEPATHLRDRRPGSEEISGKELSGEVPNKRRQLIRRCGTSGQTDLHRQTT